MEPAKVGADGDGKAATTVAADAETTVKSTVATDAAVTVDAVVSTTASAIADPTGKEENPNSEESSPEQEEEELGYPAASSLPSTRTPFTVLSQVDSDLALARTLQEQERAYMMLRLNNEGSDSGSWETGSFVHEDEDDFGDTNIDNEVDENYEEYEGTEEEEEEEEDDDGDNDDDEEEEDAFDANAHADSEGDNNPSAGVELDPSAFSSDEAFTRALQDAEDRELAARLMALSGIHDRDLEDIEDHAGNSLDMWDDVDPDELSYEELLALGEAVGTESRGLSADKIASLPSINYKTSTSQEGANDSCVICRLDYEDGDSLTVLYCKHSYHADCLDHWLRINKVCPVCSMEVSTSENR